MEVLDKANLKIRNKYPFTNDIENFCTIHESGALYQINFESIGCKNSYNGKCIMCDYGRGRNISKEELEVAIKYAIKNIKPSHQVLLVNTYGSILDEFEFSKENLVFLLEEISKLKFNTIIFETHYKTITQEKIDLIKSYIKEKQIYFEIGIETFNEQYRKYCLNKEINNEELFKTVKLIKENGCFTTGNLLVGIPFLDTKEQLEDAINSINIAFENGIDEVTLFPINIKKYTLLYKLYNNSFYSPISSWMLIEILNNIKEEYLDKITFAWFGNRDMLYSNNSTVFPITCDKCKEKLNDFFENIIKFNKEEKLEILAKLNKEKCECKENFYKNLEIKTFKSFKERILEVYSFLEKMN